MENTVVAKKRQSIPKEGIIKVLTDGNPKRKNSQSFDRFALYKDGMTVGEYIAAGGRTGDLQYDLDNKFIEVSV